MYEGDPQTPKLKQLLRFRQPPPTRQHKADKWRWKEPSENKKIFEKGKFTQFLGQCQPVFLTLWTGEVRPRQTVHTESLLQPDGCFGN